MERSGTDRNGCVFLGALALWRAEKPMDAIAWLLECMRRSEQSEIAIRSLVTFCTALVRRRGDLHLADKAIEMLEQSPFVPLTPLTIMPRVQYYLMIGDVTKARTFLDKLKVLCRADGVPCLRPWCGAG